MAQSPEPATILLVEDERATAEVVRGMLEAYGYRVVYTTNGFDALILYRQLGEWIDLILTDMRMPRMNGFELVRAIRDFDDDVSIIVLSGRSRAELPTELEDAICGWIRKPAEAEHLSRQVRRAIEAGG